MIDDLIEDIFDVFSDGAIIVIGILLFVFVFLGHWSIPTDGSATDTIARVSYEGLIFKTWSVYLTNDHPISDGYGGYNAQKYGVAYDEILLRQLQHYQETGEKVRIYFKGNLFVWIWDYSDTEIIYKVEVV